MHIRTIIIDDHPTLIRFWKSNYFVNDMDGKRRFQLFLVKNPELSVLIEENGEILGTALGSFDGRRGYIQKVVTAKKFRNKGIGKQLVTEVIKRLRTIGTLYIPISVEEKNVSFYTTCGFKKTSQVPMNMNVS